MMHNSVALQQHVFSHEYSNTLVTQTLVVYMYILQSNVLSPVWQLHGSANFLIQTLVT